MPKLCGAFESRTMSPEGAGGVVLARAAPSEAGPGDKASRGWKVAAVLAAVATVAAAWLVTGVFGAVYGADDNGDGTRLTCPARLAADTPSQRTAWQGGVVVNYRVAEYPGCAGLPVYPTTRRLLLNALTPDEGVFSLRTLAAVESSFLGVAVGCGVLLLRRWGAAGMAALAVVAVAAVAPVMARFFVSPYSESAGLVGAVLVLVGVAGVLANPVRARAERVASLALVLCGGLYGGLAKQAYVPLAAVAALVLLLAKPWEPQQYEPGQSTRGRILVGRALPRLVSACLCAALVVPVCSWYRAGTTWAEELRLKERTDADFVLGAVAPELERRGGSLADLGLPESLQDLVGMDTWPPPSRMVQPDWVHYFTEGGADSRRRAAGVVMRDPGLAYTLVTRAIAATDGVRIPYLAPNEVGRKPSESPVRDVLDKPYAVVGAVDTTGGGTVGLTSLLAVCLVGPTAYAAKRRRRGPVRPGIGPVDGPLLLASAAAGLALLTCLVAVWGDGYYELAKHVWLAAFFAVVAVGISLTTLAAYAVRRLRGDRT
ncbi:hypothetical protein [Yinghuangia seranimata]|uniref:glycan biosynthesis hexose transferase WsfD n=1 Tax=Yinghuangia seranimata TaxID=408067 RepID=UPI00248AC787|nr:hypothetical protein [Yinghuangia seranimata]MDI2131538.1 hypothetical protein [Yinghuangia seranimata]